MSDTPLRRGYVEALAGASTLSGPYVRGEAGYKFLPDLASYAFAQWTPREVLGGVGVRFEF